jgi:hypothetical protein
VTDLSNSDGQLSLDSLREHGLLTDQPVRSYSQLNQYGECPKQYELQRVYRVPRRPGVWFPAGSAVHRAIELWLRQKIQEGS